MDFICTARGINSENGGNYKAFFFTASLAASSSNHRPFSAAAQQFGTAALRSVESGLMSLRSAGSASAGKAMAKPPSLHEELTSLSEELAGGKLVKNLTLFPSIQITLVHPDMVREFEQSCQVR